jgi:hypothetical protein
MIYFLRTATISQGKQQEAIQWAIKVAKYLNDKYPEMNVQVLRNINGPLNQVHWAVGYESLAVMEESRAKRLTDAGYQDLLGETSELFDPLVVDNFYQVIE